MCCSQSGRGLPAVLMSKRKMSAWCGPIEEEDVCLVWSYRRGRYLPNVVLSKGKMSAWCGPIEGEEVCVV